jgi:hypothetical protein
MKCDSQALVFTLMLSNGWLLAAAARNRKSATARILISGWLQAAVHPQPLATAAAGI